MPTLKTLRISALQSCIRTLDLLSIRRRRALQRPAHLATGERGEQAAYFFLRRNGFTVVARRWNEGPLPGDLDLVAWQGEILCFIEVKTRTTLGLAPAQAAVDQNKRKILRRLARQYLRQLPGQISEHGRPETRFDIITVYELEGKPQEVKLIANAFGWQERPWQQR
jgi:putative endonuclease